MDVFRPTRGLRQGDPISPYLFLIAAEGLSCFLKGEGGISGISVAPNAPAVNHLLFADDNLLFFEANELSAVRINDLLRTYCNASGQRVNTEKSSIFSVREFLLLLVTPLKILLMFILNHCPTSTLVCLQTWAGQRRAHSNI